MPDEVDTILDTTEGLGDLFGNDTLQPSELPIKIDREHLANALAAQITSMSLEQVVSIITNRYDELIQYMELTRGKKACQKTSLLFNPHRLDCPTTTDKHYGSIFKALQSPDFHSGLARATIFRTGEMSTRRVGEVFYMTIQIGVNGTCYVNEFPPHLARDLYKSHLVNKDGRHSKVLDPCGGWGGRMIGCSVVCDNYTAYEPATRTAEGLTALAEFIRSINPSFNADVNCQPYEDSDEKPGYYDFALTSPPYYDTEQYSDEETNSCNRYPTFQEWAEKFFTPMIDKTIRQLKPGQPFIFNVGDRKYPLSKTLIEHCAKMDYTLRRVDNRLVNNPGFGREADAGEKFYEIRKTPTSFEHAVEQVFEHVLEQQHSDISTALVAHDEQIDETEEAVLF